MTPLMDTLLSVLVKMEKLCYEEEIPGTGLGLSMGMGFDSDFILLLLFCLSLPMEHSFMRRVPWYYSLGSDDYLVYDGNHS